MIHLYIYLVVCALIFIGLVGYGAYEDYFIRPKKIFDPKFGPNLKSGFFWMIVMLTSIPVLNLVILALVMYDKITGNR